MDNEESKEYEKMDSHTPVNVFTTPSSQPMWGGGGFGGGFGGDSMGALLAVALLGGGGFGGRFGGRGDTVGDIPGGALGDFAIMNAISGVKDTINTSVLAVTGQLAEGFANTATNTMQQTQLLTAQASINQLSAIQALNSVNQNVSAQGSDTRTAVAADGNATRALIAQLNTDNLNRLLTVADLDRRDEISRGRSREVEVNVTQTVNQQQLQLQAQQQQQAIVSTLGFLCNEIAQVKQVARATNENVIVGNTGATTTGAQTANPTNVNT